MEWVVLRSSVPWLYLHMKHRSQDFCAFPVLLLTSNPFAFPGTLSPMFSALLWVAVAICTSMLFFFSKPVGIRPFLVSVMLRSIYTIGLGPTLILLGAANVSILLSFVSYGIQTY